MNISNYSVISTVDSTLRPYQQKGKEQIFCAWNECDNVMFQMPTGTGKTRLFTSIIKDINNFSIQKKEAVKILIIAHRTELIEQIDESLTRYHIAHNIIAGGYKRNIKYPVNVASIQTLTHPNNLEFASKLNVQFVIIDEAHHAKASTYKKLWKLYPKSKKLGVTATPWRMNHSGFTDLFDKLITSLSIKQFIKDGYLSPYRYFSLKTSSNIQKTIDDIALDAFGEYKEDSMEEHMDIGSIRAQLLKSYQALANGKKGIIYAINILHAQHICKEYENAGFVAVAIDSKTPSKERKRLVSEFRKGEIDIIVNVDIFSEGFDCPDIEFIQLARPTRSLVKYLQQVGRGLRKVENKDTCIILDNVGMYSRFGLPDANRMWRHHFIGQKVIEVPQIKSTGTGWGTRSVDMSEGCEDMELIEDNSNNDTNQVVPYMPETSSNEISNIVQNNTKDIISSTLVDENQTEENDYVDNIQIVSFNPEKWAKQYNFYHAGYLFWLPKHMDVYEIYLHNNEIYVINRLDVHGIALQRVTIAMIISNSPLFNRLENEDTDQIVEINYYGGEKTIIDLRSIDSYNQEVHQYFDYYGKQFSNHSAAKQQYLEESQNKEITYTSLELQIAVFHIEKVKNFLTIYKNIGKHERLVARILSITDFGQEYRKAAINSSHFYVFRNSDLYLYVREVLTDGTSKNIVFTIRGKKVREVDIPPKTYQKDYVKDSKSNEETDVTYKSSKIIPPSEDIMNGDVSNVDISSQNEYSLFARIFDNQSDIDKEFYKNSFIDEIKGRGYGEIEPEEIYPIKGSFYDFNLTNGAIEILKYETSFDCLSLEKVGVAYADRNSDFCKAIRNRQIVRLNFAGQINDFGNYGIETTEINFNTGEYYQGIYDENGDKINDNEPMINIGLDDSYSPGDAYSSFKWDKEHERLSLIIRHNDKNDRDKRARHLTSSKGKFIEKNGNLFDVYSTLVGTTVIEHLSLKDGVVVRRIVGYFHGKHKLPKDVILNAYNILFYDYGGYYTAFGVRKDANSPFVFYDFYGSKIFFHTSIKCLSELDIDEKKHTDLLISNEQIYLDQDIKWSVSIQKKSISIYNDSKKISIPKDNPAYREISELSNPLVKCVFAYRKYYVLELVDDNGKQFTIRYYLNPINSFHTDVLIPNMPKTKKGKYDKVNSLSSKILSALSQHKDGLSPSAIADIVRSDISTVTILLNSTLKDKVQKDSTSRSIKWSLRN